MRTIIIAFFVMAVTAGCSPANRHRHHIRAPQVESCVVVQEIGQGWEEVATYSARRESGTVKDWLQCVTNHAAMLGADKLYVRGADIMGIPALDYEKAFAGNGMYFRLHAVAFRTEDAKDINLFEVD